MTLYVSQTTIYIGSYFEKNTTTGVATSYYAFNEQTVAMRQGSTVMFLHGDALGSASVTTNNAGAKIAEARYASYVAPNLIASNAFSRRSSMMKRAKNSATPNVPQPPCHMRFLRTKPRARRWHCMNRLLKFRYGIYGNLERNHPRSKPPHQRHRHQNRTLFAGAHG